MMEMSMLKIVCALVFLGLLQGEFYAEEVDHNNWIDWSLPRSVPVAPFEGERYEAVVPDTADLVFHASCALNMATRLWAPEWGYEQLFDIWMDTNPPRMEAGHGGLTDCGPKVIEALPMLRVMTGSTYNIKEDGNIMMSIVRITGKDGLCYQPIENRPWAFFDDYNRKEQTPFADVFGEGRQLLAYASWYQHDRNPLWKNLAERKINRLMELTLGKNNTLYFRTSRGFNPWDKDQAHGDIIPIGDHNLYESDKGIVGTAAACVTGFIPQAGSIWCRINKNKTLEELSGGLAKYLYHYGELIDAETGRFIADHETHVTHSLIANLSWALTFKDEDMIQWVKRGYEYFLKSIDPDDTGVVFGQEACRVSDSIGIGIMLSQAGYGDYWETVERLLLNTYLDMQVTDSEWIKNQPFKLEETLDSGWYQPIDGADWCIGVWRHFVDKSRLQAAGCCNGNCSRMLYYIWNNIATVKDKEFRINLLLNKASELADIDSWLPYEGKVKVTMKTTQDKLMVRIPEWVDKDKVTCKVGRKTADIVWAGNYVDVGKVQKGDKVLIEFPMKIRTLEARTQLLLEQDGENEIWDKKKCTITYKGNTLIDFTPDLGYPIEQHIKYRADKAPMKKITRFISKEKFLF
jgi:hypothetical protein